MVKDYKLRKGDLCIFDVENTLHHMNKETYTVKIVEVLSKLFKKNRYKVVCLQTGKVFVTTEEMLLPYNETEINSNVIVRYPADFPQGITYQDTLVYNLLVAYYELMLEVETIEDLNRARVKSNLKMEDIKDLKHKLHMYYITKERDNTSREVEVYDER